MEQIWSSSKGLGTTVKDLILGFASILKEDYVPGLVALGFVFALIAVLIGLYYQSNRALRSIRAAQDLIANADDEVGFQRQLNETNQTFTTWRDAGRGDRGKLGTAWAEYRETLILPAHEGDGGVIGNTHRPGEFFNRIDLGLSFPFFRSLPALFVSIGLALTFFGLIAALQQTGESLKPGAATDGVDTNRALQDLLTVASAKFIMSLMGLLCSIILGVVIRYRIGRIDDALHTLCTVIEHRLVFLSAEDLAQRQLDAITAQSEQMKGLNTELIAAFDRPLREDLPRAISASISSAMEPLVRQIGQAGSDGVGEMVNDLSSRFSKDVGEALGTASSRLAEAGETIGRLADRMDASSARMGSEMQSSVAQIAATIQGIQSSMAEGANAANTAFAEGTENMLASMRDALSKIEENTARNAATLDNAARALAEAAGAFKTEVGTASIEAREAAKLQIETSAAAIASQAEALRGKATEDLLAPLDALRASFDQITEKAASSARDMTRFASETIRGADAAQGAATSMAEASGELSRAAAPIRDIAGRFESSGQQTALAVTTAAASFQSSGETIVRGAEGAVSAARETLGGERQAIEASLGALAQIIERFEGVASRHDVIDEKLGDAFKTFETQITRAISDVRNHADGVHEQFGGALDKLREVISQAEDFTPESSGR